MTIPKLTQESGIWQKRRLEFLSGKTVVEAGNVQRTWPMQTDKKGQDAVEAKNRFLIQLGYKLS